MKFKALLHNNKIVCDVANIHTGIKTIAKSNNKEMPYIFPADATIQQITDPLLMRIEMMHGKEAAQTARNNIAKCQLKEVLLTVKQ